MKLRDMLPSWPALVGFTLLSLYTKLGDGSTIAYCSTQNDPVEGTQLFGLWNSNGACETHCGAKYAFAVVQWQTCWCSNYIPADTTSVDDCNQSCPGWTPDKCGNTTLGLYGYIALSAPPSGTIGASSSSPSLIQPAPTLPLTTTIPVPAPVLPSTIHVSETVSVTVPVTQTPSPSVEVSYVTRVPPIARLSISPQVTSIAPSPTVSTLVVTSAGAPVTETVTSTPLVIPNSDSETVQAKQKSGLSAGAVAGIVLGVLFGVAALALAGFLLWRRRQNRSNEDAAGATAANGSHNRPPKRNISVLSKTGLLARARPSMTERERERDREHDEHYFIPPLAGTNSLRHSMLLGLGGDGVDPSSPLSGSQGEEARRSSKPFIYDQRLNPSALYASHDNGSRVSMQDNNDYSRPLGVANPDTRPSFDSRMSR